MSEARRLTDSETRRLADSNEKLHALCSASGASRWLLCPGSIWACAQVEPETPSKYAEEGIKAHALAEHILNEVTHRQWRECLKDDWGVTPVDLLWADKIRAEYTEEMIKAVVSYIEWVVIEKVEFDSPPEIQIETKLVLNETMQMFGTADLAMIGLKGGEDCGVVMDFKYGKTRVSTTANPQLAYYACALRRTAKKRLKRVKVAVVQPRIKNGIDWVEYSEEHLDEWENILIKAADKAILQIAEEPGKREFEAGNHCKYCRGISLCPLKNKAPGPEEGLEFYGIDSK